MRAAGKDHVGTAAADQLKGFADGLRAGGAGGQAVGVEPPGAVDARQVARRCSRLLLGFTHRVQLFHAHPRKLGRVDAAVARRAVDQADEPREILLAFA